MTVSRDKLWRHLAHLRGEAIEAKRKEVVKRIDDLKIQYLGGHGLAGVVSTINNIQAAINQLVDDLTRLHMDLEGLDMTLHGRSCSTQVVTQLRTWAYGERYTKDTIQSLVINDKELDAKIESVTQELVNISKAWDELFSKLRPMTSADAVYYLKTIGFPVEELLPKEKPEFDTSRLNLDAVIKKARGE